MAFDKWPFDLGRVHCISRYCKMQDVCSEWHGEASFTKMNLIYRQEV